MMKLVAQAEGHVEYADGLLVKVVFHVGLLVLALWLLFGMASGAVLVLSDRQAELVRTSTVGTLVQRHAFSTDALVEARLQRARHHPGSGPPTLSSRVELVPTVGDPIPLTRAYGANRPEMMQIVRQVNTYLADPHGTLVVSQDHHRPTAFLAGLILLYVLYALAWGVQQTRLVVNRNQGRLTLVRRRLLSHQVQPFALARISHLELQTLNAQSEKRARVQPVLVLSNRDIVPLLPPSGIGEKRVREMLERLGEVGGLPVR